jgi:hypothetical protein
MHDPALPRRLNGDPYQALYHWADGAQGNELALGPNGVPLVWVVGLNESRDPEDWTVEEAPPQIAEAAWEWLSTEGV